MNFTYILLNFIKNYLLAVLFFFGLMTTGYAQNIPDANFAEAIRYNCSTCITASPSNNLTADAATLTELYLEYRDITSLSGIGGFRSLQNLYVVRNRLTSLPDLPSSLIRLYCDYNQLTSLPALPSGLKLLRAYSNRLTRLPALPTSLITLDIGNNLLSSLPTLPDGLGSLQTDGNPDLTTLPHLPASMYDLWIDYIPSRISCLPNAVAGMYVLNNYLFAYAHVTSIIPICSGSACSPSIVASPVVVSTVTQTSCIGEPLGLTASATAVGTSAMTVKWQRKKPSAADFTDVTAAAEYVSGTVVYYTVPAISAEDNLTQYRAVFSGTCANSVAVGTAPAEVATRDGMYIPDVYFRNAILRDCPTCINNCGNLTTDAERITKLDVDDAASNQFITDLTGIEGFVNLEELNISNNNIKIFTRLPEKLKKLKVTNNNLTRLPALPNTLEMLDCRSNNLTALPALPNALKLLDCSSNKIAVLPDVLPVSLLALDCSNNALIGLPATLPAGLRAIYCQKNNLVTLPTLPTDLTYFNCGNNLLSALPPTLPTALHSLICSNNPTLFCLPTLPDALRELYISPENIKCLRNAIAGLRFYDPMNEELAALPVCVEGECRPSSSPNTEGGQNLADRVSGSKSGLNILTIFPNPVDKELTIQVNATTASDAKLTLTDILGRTQASQIVPLSIGANSTTIDVSNLPRGAYFIVVNDGKTQAVKRVVKN
jgi:hypothetical protein